MTDLRQPEVWPLSEELTEILQALIVERSQGVILNFVDTARHMDAVEIWIDSDGKINYLAAAKPVEEGRSKPWLVFDFAYQEYRQNGNKEDLEEGAHAFRAWQIQFCRNFQKHKYEVKYNEYTV